MTDVVGVVDAGRRSGGDVLAPESAVGLASPGSLASPGPATMSPPHADAPSRTAAPIDCASLTGLLSTELLRALSEASPFPLAIWRRHDGLIVHCNGKLGELLGLSPSELVGRSTLDFYQESADREVALRELDSRGRMCEREFRLKTPSGGSVWATFSVEPLEVEGQALLLGTLHDVTGRRELADRLKESETRFRCLMENSSELVFVLDRHATLTYLSPNVTRILGYAPSQLLGRNIDALVHGCDVARLWSDSDRAREMGGSRPGSELRMRHKDGSVRWFCTTFAPALDAQGQASGLTGAARDITPEKSAAEELERMSKSLREAQLQLARAEKMASLGLLMAGIAHELRTPLGAVSNTQRTISQALDKLGERLNEAFPEALADSKLGRLLKVLTDSTRVVGDGSTRMTDIVQRLRKFSCADEAKLCAVDVNAIAEDTLALIHHELKNYVAIQRRYGEGVTLMGYPARLNQVLVNLLINAAQAVRARGNGKITLETRAVGDHIEISVSDDGVGIPPENLRNIFACGFTTRQDEGGSGLGLAISKEIVDAHHGSLEVKSQVGAGTTFTVRLPRSLADCRKPSRGCRF
jgi:two-component system, NtrC family, sensor kinase